MAYERPEYLDNAKVRRDIAEAKKIKRGYRKEKSLDQMLGAYMRSPEMRRMQRLQKVQGVLDAHFGNRVESVKPQRIDGKGTLHLAVVNTLLLNEIRHHHSQALLVALQEAGCAVTKLHCKLVRK